VRQRRSAGVSVRSGPAADGGVLRSLATALAPETAGTSAPRTSARPPLYAIPRVCLCRWRGAGPPSSDEPPQGGPVRGTARTPGPARLRWPPSPRQAVQPAPRTCNNGCARCRRTESMNLPAKIASPAADGVRAAVVGQRQPEARRPSDSCSALLAPLIWAMRGRTGRMTPHCWLDAASSPTTRSTTRRSWRPSVHQTSARRL